MWMVQDAKYFEMPAKVLVQVEEIIIDFAKNLAKMAKQESQAMVKVKFSLVTECQTLVDLRKWYLAHLFCAERELCG